LTLESKLIRKNALIGTLKLLDNLAEGKALMKIGELKVRSFPEKLSWVGSVPV
jgi:hypothetical protein